ncbi:hypothetical protein IMSAGC015_01690 [Lachnospiraceae bacterium]|nr:hypothetical protein IMSAGC015_01690 [Lachnospiraceae bacterium]
MMYLIDVGGLWIEQKQAENKRNTGVCRWFCGRFGGVYFCRVILFILLDGGCRNKSGCGRDNYLCRTNLGHGGRSCGWISTGPV